VLWIVRLGAWLCSCRFGCLLEGTISQGLSFQACQPAPILASYMQIVGLLYHWYHWESGNQLLLSPHFPPNPSASPPYCYPEESTSPTFWRHAYNWHVVVV
jgi:hypothetical protein